MLEGCRTVAVRSYRIAYLPVRWRNFNLKCSGSESGTPEVKLQVFCAENYQRPCQSDAELGAVKAQRPCHLLPRPPSRAVSVALDLAAAAAAAVALAAAVAAAAAAAGVLGVVVVALVLVAAVAVCALGRRRRSAQASVCPFEGSAPMRPRAHAMAW